MTKNFFVFLLLLVLLSQILSMHLELQVQNQGREEKDGHSILEVAKLEV